MDVGYAKNIVLKAFFCCLGCTFFCHAAQEPQLYCPCDYEQSPLTWSGHISTEAWFDTRQTVGFYGHQFIVFPKPKLCDVNGCDINAHPDFGIVPFNILLNGRLDGPALFCSDQTYIFFSGDFSSGDEISEPRPVFRFRRGYIHFDWGCYAFLAGQEDHPLYIPECAANTVGFAAGEPITTTARAPQLRFTWRPDYVNEKESGATGNDEISFALLSQDTVYSSNGPIGYSLKYIQDGVMPEMNLNWQKYIDDTTFCGVGVNFKRLVPRLATVDFEFKDSKGITSGIFYAYCAHVTPEFSLKNQLFYVHDGSEFDFISGYAVACEDPVTKKRSYTNLRSLSYWLDAELFPGSSFSPGVFLGVARNMGADKKLFRDEGGNLITYTTLNSADIRLVGRVAPRIWYNCGPVTIGVEVEWTYAEYGKLNDFGEVTSDIVPVGNVRFLGSLFYRF